MIQTRNPNTIHTFHLRPINKNLNNIIRASPSRHNTIKNLELVSPSFNQFNLDCCHFVLVFNFDRENKLNVINNVISPPLSSLNYIREAYNLDEEEVE